MTNKDLTQLLKGLGEVKPDSQWKEANREILLSQINSGNETQSNLKVGQYSRVAIDFIYNGFIKQLSQPVLATVLVFVLLIGGSLYSLGAATDTTPGDSLYSAKIIGEKTQMALTFGNKNKTKLNIEFAENRVNELTKVLSDDSVNGERKEKVEKLAGSFKKEIENVRQRIERINSDAKDNEPENTEVAVKDNEEGTEEAMVFSANLGKDDDGLSLSEGSSEKDVEEVIEDEPVAEVIEAPVLEVETSTEEVLLDEDSELATSSEVTSDEPQAKTQVIFEEAKQLLEDEDYNAIIEKLDEVVTHVDSEVAQSEVEVKGAETVVEEGSVVEPTNIEVSEDRENIVEDEGAASSTVK